MAYYIIRAAGREGGYVKTLGELDAELTDVKKLMMSSQGRFLPDVFRNLGEHAIPGRLLIAEKITAGEAVIEGCVAYTLLEISHPHPATGRKVKRRVNMVRILNVRESPDRAEIARRLCLEAQLRGTVRSLYDNPDEPQVIGTLGVIMAGNAPALKWASLLRPRVAILSPGSRFVRNDPVLAALRRYADRIRFELGGGEPYRFVVANRRSLIDAAWMRAGGHIPNEPGSDELRVSYDSTDRFGDQIDVNAANLRYRNRRTLVRFALNGDPSATPWGSPPTAAMGFEVVEDEENTLESSGR
jgi:hypothetical protein